jgi:hypothetical protein
MTVTEKAAYVKGLAEGLNLDENKAETKLFKAVLDLLDDLSLSVADLDDEVAALAEHLDAVDEDLDLLESDYYEDFDEDDDCDCDGEDCYEIECPSCGEVVCVDGGVLEEGGIDCPACGALLEFDLDDACKDKGCGCENKE